MRIRNPIVIAAVLSVVTFVIYQLTLAPGVGFIDAGELATDCYTLGIPHPTGYPLFVLLGYLISHIPVGSVIGRLNEMAAFFTAIGAGAMFLLAQEIFQSWLEIRSEIKAAATKSKHHGNTTKQIVREHVAPHIALVAALAVSLTAAFSQTWWEQSNGIEVYPLHLALIPITLIFFLRMLRNEDEAKVHRDGLLFGLFLGLSFTNHMTTVLLAPGCLYLFFARYRFTKLAFLRIRKLAIPFCGALLLYSYLPIRSSMMPLMDWGHPVDWTLFLRHVTGGQYKIWMFTGSAAKNWNIFWSSLPSEFTILGLLLGVIGLIALLKMEQRSLGRMSVFTLLLFFGCLVYAINYGIHDISSYFLLAYLTFAIWIGVGIIAIGHYLRSNPRHLVITSSIAAILVALMLYTNYQSADESGNYMVDDFTANQLDNLPKNAIIFSSAWDFWVSGAYYYQNIEHRRPDVIVMDRAMLHDRAWYYEYLQKRAPDVLSRCEPELSNFLHYLQAFDRGDPYDGTAISNAYRAFTEALVERNQDRPIYLAQDMLLDPDPLFAPGFKPVPAGIEYRLVRRDTMFQPTLPTIHWRDAQYHQRNYYTDDARLLQASPLMAYAKLLAARREYKQATDWVNLALQFAPDNNAPLSGLSERDQSFANEANIEFDNMRQYRTLLLQHSDNETH